MVIWLQRERKLVVFTVLLEVGGNLALAGAQTCSLYCLVGSGW